MYNKTDEWNDSLEVATTECYEFLTKLTCYKNSGRKREMDEESSSLVWICFLLF